MDYKSTLNLPKTEFAMKANLTLKEPEFLAAWEARGLYQEIRRLRKGKPKYVLHDGPPYANGDIHIGHAFNKILKDLIVKYKTMKGFDAPYQPGWDCHGMPIEHALFEKLGKTKQEVDQLEFRRQAYQFAMNFVGKQREQFKRLGVFGEWEAPYLTLAPDYEAAIVRMFRSLFGKGYIYRRKKPVLWCATCETALAEAEVEYEDRPDISIYVKFEIPKDSLKEFSRRYTTDKDAPELDKLLHRRVYFLVWTTTPWTLPANVALALHPKLLYGAFHIGEETFFLATERVQLLDTLGLKYKSAQVSAHGDHFLGLKYVRPFSPEPGVVVTSEFVSMEKGTDIVHIAPGHGEEDYHVGLRNDLPIFSPVDEKGCFTTEVPLPSLKGKNVFKANAEIIEELKKKGTLLHEEKITHSYPHCWRCKNPVIFRATEQWFLNVDHLKLRRRLLEATEKVRWIPDVGKNRMQGMLEVRPDWCLSRQRYWGVPIPIFYCKACRKPLDDPKVFDQIENLFRQHGSDIWFEKSFSELLPKGTRCVCGSDQFDQEKDILDVWFDSGVSHEAVLKRRGEWPASLYLEGSDQHRGWFQVSLIPAVALEEKAPYQGVLTHGFVMDGEGFKMSKSRGNVVSPQEVIAHFGADVLRLWVFSTRTSEDVRISKEILERTTDAYRKIRNTLKYLLGNLYDFKPEAALPYGEMLEVDRWALLKLSTLIQEVTEAMEGFEFHRASQVLHQFCVIEMSSFYLDLLKDRLYTLKADSRERRSGQSALYQIFYSLCRLLVPVLPFTAEEAFQSYFGKERSVHLESWPEADRSWKDPELEKRWEKLLQVREAVLKAIETMRQRGECGSSLEVQVRLQVEKGGLLSWLASYAETLMSLLIVSDISVIEVEGLPKGEPSLPVGIAVAKAEGKKCQRCWNWRRTVGRSREFPDLCDRCLDVVTVLS